MNNSHVMISFKLTKALAFFLITAFLTMQWSTVHIHLAENHDHDGSHHQHNVSVHAHELINLHDNLIDSNSQLDNNNIKVVELDCECKPQSGKRFNDQPAVSTLVIQHFDFFFQKEKIVTSQFKSPKHHYLDYSTVHLRAPPKQS